MNGAAVTMVTLNDVDFGNLLNLIGRTNITGAECDTVTLLKQKVAVMRQQLAATTAQAATMTMPETATATTSAATI